MALEAIRAMWGHLPSTKQLPHGAEKSSPEQETIKLKLRAHTCMTGLVSLSSFLHSGHAPCEVIP